MKATEQYLFIMLYKVVLTFESVDEILKCNLSSESYTCWAELSCPVVILWYKVVLTFDSLDEINTHDTQVWSLKLKLLSSTFLGYYFYGVQGDPII